MKKFRLITVLALILSAGLFAACGKRDKGIEYEKYLLDVNCGEKFKGKIYQMGHTSASIYFIWYKDEKGRKIELPDDGCVKITLQEFPVPKTESK